MKDHFLVTRLFLLLCVVGKFSFAQSEIFSLEKERLTLTDGSFLLGKLVELSAEKGVVWKHLSSDLPIRFDFESVKSVTMNRSDGALPLNQENLTPIEIQFSNGDYLKGSLLSLDDNQLHFSTAFAKKLSVDVSKLMNLNFLPKKHQVIFKKPSDFKYWKKSNSASWKEENGELLSFFSGSTGTTLPELDGLSIRFEAEWQRSFYLALRIFSDSDGGSYGNTGYHLSFSNNRINLQSNKQLNGRTIRETLGSLLADELSGAQSAKFEIYAHRRKKEFIVKVNDLELVRWQDPDPDFIPDENGILLINQGGNSFIRLKELSISGWQGEFFPHSTPKKDKNNHKPQLIFSNGDSVLVQKLIANDQNSTIQTQHGSFTLPISRLQQIDYQNSEHAVREEPVEAKNSLVLLIEGLGKLNLQLEKVSNHHLEVKHQAIGQFSVPLNLIHKINTNLDLTYIEEHLTLLESAELAIKQQNSSKALQALNKTRTSYRSWYWKRLLTLAENLRMDEMQSFYPYPKRSLANVDWLNESDSIITVSTDGNVSIWRNQKELLSHQLDFKVFSELSRNVNEGLRMVNITHPFWISKTEITHQHFDLDRNESNSGDISTIPVMVSWEEAIAFCQKLNQNHPPPAGYTWRLATEAEWEYACRAGSQGPYCQTSIGTLSADPNSYQKHLEKFAWFDQNSQGKIQPVALKKSNAWGLFDMHGNLSEWCLDSVSQNKLSFLTDRKAGVNDPFVENGEWRVTRGGSYQSSFDQCRSAFRDGKPINPNSSLAGLRVVLGPDVSEINIPREIQYSQIKTAAKSPNFSTVEVKPGSYLMGSIDKEYFPKIIPHSTGTNIFISTTKGPVRKLDLTQKLVKAIFNPKASIVKIQICQNGKLLLAGSVDGKVIIYDLVDEKITHTFNDHTTLIHSLAINHKSSLLLTSCLNGDLVLRDLDENRVKWKLESKDYSDFFDHLEFSTDSTRLLASAKYGSVQIFDAKTGQSEVIADKSKRLALKAHWNPKGRFFYVLFSGGILVQYESSKGIIYREIDFQLPQASDFSLSRDGKQIMLFSDDGLCTVRKLPIDDSIIILHPNQKTEVSPDFYFRLKQKNEVPEEDTLDNFLAKFKTSEISKKQKSISHSSDGNWVITSLDGTLRLWSATKKTFFKNISGKLISPFTDCAFAPNDEFLAGKLESGHIFIFPAKSINEVNLKENISSYRSWFSK